MSQYETIPDELKEFIENPFLVHNEKGSRFIVKNDDDATDVATIVAYATKFNGMLIHLGGGCKGLPEGGEEKMLLYFLNIFHESTKGLCSGGTTDVNQTGQKKIMITEIPPAVSILQGNATFASFPRVGSFRFKGEGTLVTSKWDTGVNTNYGLNIAVQKDPFNAFLNETGDDAWDGDLRNRFEIYDMLKQSGTDVIFIGFNGGDVTRDEMLYGIQAGYPTFLVEGSGRATDALIALYREYQDDKASFKDVFGVLPDEATVEIIHFDDVEGSREMLMRYGVYDTISY